MGETVLNRGLSDEFLSSLQSGSMAPIICAAKTYGLDLQIREDYINLYHRGLSLLKLTHSRRGSYRAEINLKFLPGVQLPGEIRRGACYATFDADDLFARQYSTSVAAVSANADRHVGSERSAEQSLVRGSLHAGSAVVIIDRQVQLHGLRKCADVIGITREDEPRLIIGELKYGLDRRIPRISEQLGHYYRMLTDPDGRLAQNVADVYRRVIEQKCRLHVLPGDVSFPARSPRVECLAILCDYSPRRPLLEEARAAAEGCGFAVRLVQPTGPDYEVPPVDEWEKLCPQRT